jgi:hypothetical protein
LDEPGDLLDILEPLGHRSLRGRREEDARSGGFPSDADALELRDDFSRDSGELIEAILGGERLAEVEKDEGSLVGEVLPGKSVGRPPVVGFGRLVVAESVINVRAEPGAMNLDQLIGLCLEERLSLSISGEGHLGFSNIYEIPAERVDGGNRKVWPSFRINF